MTKDNLFKKQVFIWIVLSSLTFSCEKYEPVHDNYSVISGAFIVCQGNYTYDNASLSFYVPKTKQVSNNIYFDANNKYLGDVAESMVIIDTAGFIVVNNSGKITVISTNTFKNIATINGFTSPRYIQVINSQKAYVSDLYNTNITVFNPQTLSVTRTIPVGKTTEQMVKYGNMVFVTNWSYENTVQEINSINDSLVSTLTVTFQPNSIVIDKYNKLWVLSDGGFQGESGKQVAALTKIDAATFTVEIVFTFPSIQYSPSCLNINGTLDTLYFISGGWEASKNSNNGVFQMPVTAQSLPVNPFIYENTKLFYGLGVDPKSSQVYVSNALDFIQPGIIYRYSPQAVLLDSFTTNVIPSFFCFKQ